MPFLYKFSRIWVPFFQVIPCPKKLKLGVCTAQQSIGDEYRWATDCVEELLEDNITVKYFTTDCDSRANAAAGDCYKRRQKEHSPPHHLKDTQHVGRGQRRKIIKTTFTVLSIRMFPWIFSFRMRIVLKFVRIRIFSYLEFVKRDYFRMRKEYFRMIRNSDREARTLTPRSVWLR